MHTNKFILDDVYSIKCKWIDRENGFRHRAKLLENGEVIRSCFVDYDNRSWESFEFESVCKKVIDRFFGETDRVIYKEKLIKNYCVC